MRLFTAVIIPEQTAQLIERFTGGIRDVRWINPQDYHLTLTFHESVAEDDLFGLESILELIDFEPFTLQLNGLGAFSVGTGSILWAAVAESKELSNLQGQISSLLAAEGFRSAEKKFVPHITIGRAKSVAMDSLVGFLEQGTFCTGAPFPVQHISLIQSELTPDGAIYTELSRFGNLE